MPQVDFGLKGDRRHPLGLIFSLRGVADKNMAPEMLLNGELADSQKLVQILESVLDKYWRLHP